MKGCTCQCNSLFQFQKESLGFCSVCAPVVFTRVAEVSISLIIVLLAVNLSLCLSVSVSVSVSVSLSLSPLPPLSLLSPSLSQGEVFFGGVRS